jgi:hypothetical protein
LKHVNNIFFTAIIITFWFSTCGFCDALCQNLTPGDSCGPNNLETCFGYRCVPFQGTLECKSVPLPPTTICRETASICGVDQFCPGARVVAAQGPGDCPNPTGDGDHDNVIDCHDLCPEDSLKQEPGICGCDNLDLDSDGDGTFDCQDNCPADPNKINPGRCGCDHREGECAPRHGGGGGAIVVPIYSENLVPPALGAPVLETVPSPKIPVQSADHLVTVPEAGEDKAASKKSGCSAHPSNAWFIAVLPMLWRLRRKQAAASRR